MSRLKVINGEAGYKKLSHLPFNRDFSLRPGLVESMKKFGQITAITLVETDVIDGVKQLYIADGQNRAMAAQFLDHTFYGFITDFKPQNEEDVVRLVAKLNNSSVPWKHYDYCKAYSSLGNNDYKELIRFANQFGLTIPTSANLLGGSVTGRTNTVTQKLKEGNFKIKSSKVAYETVNLVRQTKPMSSRMILAFHRVRLTLDNFDFIKFKTNFEADYEKLIAEAYDTYFNIFMDYSK